MVVLGDAKFKKESIYFPPKRIEKGVEDPEYFVFWYKFKLLILHISGWREYTISLAVMYT